jgi:hypothetical protein
MLSCSLCVFITVFSMHLNTKAIISQMPPLPCCLSSNYYPCSLVPHSCSSFMFLIHVPHSCSSFTFLIHVPHSCSSFMFLIHVPHAAIIFFYSRFNYDPSVQVPPKVYPVSDVGGADRYKFFRRYCNSLFLNEVKLS